MKFSVCVVLSTALKYRYFLVSWFYIFIYIIKIKYLFLSLRKILERCFLQMMYIRRKIIKCMSIIDDISITQLKTLNIENK